MFLVFFTPALLILIGFLTLIFPPKKINPLYGFRTSLAMKSQQAWDYANRKMSYLFMLFGSVLAAIHLIIYFAVTKINPEQSVESVLGSLNIFTLLAVIFLIVLIVQKLLKKNFDSQGIPK